MMEAKEIEPPDCAIFADTRAEPAHVYRYLDYLRSKLSFPIHVVTRGEGLTWGITETCQGRKACGTFVLPPLFLSSGGILWRRCTMDYKLRPIWRKLKELRQRRPVTMILGISSDESKRMREPKQKYLTHEYPLIEKRLSRIDCLRWLLTHGHPQPGKSACVYCPFRCNKEWLALQHYAPSDFAEAVRMDALMRHAPLLHKGNAGYVHRSLKPLNECKFDDGGQTNLFEYECEGMCGL